MIDEAFVINHLPPDQVSQETLHSGVEVGDEVAAELAAGVSQPLRIESGHRHKEQPYTLCAGAGNGDGDAKH